MQKIDWRLIPALLLLVTLNSCVKSAYCQKSSTCGKCQKTTNSGTTADPVICDNENNYTAVKYACEHRDTTNTTIIEQGWIDVPSNYSAVDACGESQINTLKANGYTCIDK
jgi:hypothetical protein